MKFIGSIFFLISSLFGAEATLSKENIVAGERVVLVLSANGKDVKFPVITNVGGFKIISTGTRQNKKNINGTITSSLEKHYTFLPLKSIEISSYEVEVDGKKKLTKPLHVEVQQANTTNSPFSLEIKIKNSEVMQFETVPIEFIFKRDKNYQVQELRFSLPKLDDFWVKEGKKSKAETEGNFIIHKMNFFIFPQKSGDFEISQASINVGTVSKSRDIFNMLTNQLNWKTIFSNTISLHVKELEGTNLNGNFNISLHVDRREIEEDKGVNATLKITGNGNFDDIEAYKLDINEANVYSDKPLVKSQATLVNVKGEFTQKFSISSKKDFIIPALNIVYYDGKSKKIVTKNTEPIAIKVNSIAQESVVVKEAIKEVAKEEIVIKKQSGNTKLIFAFMIGVFVTFFIMKIVSKKKYKLPKFKDDREHLKALLKKRGESEEINKKIKEIEDKLYS
ncbi:MAG: BatD family protein [Sulfurospirillum sp.]|nr:BatD family protein [Sulfurospirillum sp.]